MIKTTILSLIGLNACIEGHQSDISHNIENTIISSSSVPTHFPTIVYSMQQDFPTSAPIAQDKKLSMAAYSSGTNQESPSFQVSDSPKKPSSYFNYDPDSEYGPKHWGDVKVKGSEYLDFTKNKRNYCRKGKHQSPVDIKKDRECVDDHKVFMRRGRQNFDTADFKILPSGLRINLKQKKLAQSAGADPSNLALLSRALFADIKIPSEHTENGRRYAAEFQITHHWDRKEGRFFVIAVWLDDTDDVPNEPLEMFIREWEEEARKIEWKCSIDKGVELKPYNRTYLHPDKKEMKRIWGEHCGSDKCKRDMANWDVYRLVPTFWYCGYKGSLTVPPCTEITHWRVFDLPLKISKDQLKRMKDLLTNQVDESCNPASIAYNGTVSRAIQSNEKVYCCDGGDFKVEVDNEDYWKSLWPKNYHGRKKGLK